MEASRFQRKKSFVVTWMLNSNTHFSPCEGCADPKNWLHYLSVWPSICFAVGRKWTVFRVYISEFSFQSFENFKAFKGYRHRHGVYRVVSLNCFTLFLPISIYDISLGWYENTTKYMCYLYEKESK